MFEDEVHCVCKSNPMIVALCEATKLIAYWIFPYIAHIFFEEGLYGLAFACFIVEMICNKHTSC